MSSSSISLVSGNAVATLDLLGGRVTSLVIDGLDLLVRAGPNTFRWGSFPMAPWAGRLRQGRLEFNGAVLQLPVNSAPHALHGLVTDRAWELLASGRRSATLALDLGRSESDPWPWPCRDVQSVSLGDDTLDFELVVEADEAMPAHVGWHPWFNRRLRPDDQVAAELEIESGQVYLNGPDGLPSGQLAAPPAPPWDYCFVGLAGPPRVRWAGVLELTVLSDCDHWVLYDEDPSGVCVEPWTGPPNCVNAPDARIVAPSDPLEAAMTWRWRRLPG